MSLLKVSLLYGVAWLLQASLLNLVAIGGITPHLILCLTLVVVFHYNGGYKVAPVALVAMLLADVTQGQYVGVGAMALFATMGVVLLLRRSLNPDGLMALVCAVVIGVMAYYTVYWVIMHFMGNPLSLLYVWKKSLLLALYDEVVCVILFLIFILRAPAPQVEIEVAFDGVEVTPPTWKEEREGRLAKESLLTDAGRNRLENAKGYVSTAKEWAKDSKNKLQEMKAQLQALKKQEKHNNKDR